MLAPPPRFGEGAGGGGVRRETASRPMFFSPQTFSVLHRSYPAAPLARRSLFFQRFHCIPSHLPANVKALQARGYQARKLQ